MVPDIHAKFQNQQFIMRRAIKLFLTLFVQNDLKWRTFSITLAKLEPQWPHSEQRSDVIHGSEPSDAVVPSSDHGRPRQYCHLVIITALKQYRHLVVSTPFIDTVLPSSDHYGTAKVAPPSDHLHTKIM